MCIRDRIETGFKPVFSIFVPAMAPGFPYAVYPHGKENGGRAHIFVAGDGDYKAHDLYPTDSLTYTDVVISDANGTVGALDFTDLDNDGWIEMWMPNYDKSYVEVFKMHPAAAEAQTEEIPAELEQQLEEAFDEIFGGWFDEKAPNSLTGEYFLQ